MFISFPFFASPSLLVCHVEESKPPSWAWLLRGLLILYKAAQTNKWPSSTLNHNAPVSKREELAEDGGTIELFYLFSPPPPRSGVSRGGDRRVPSTELGEAPAVLAFSSSFSCRPHFSPHPLLQPASWNAAHPFVLLHPEAILPQIQQLLSPRPTAPRPCPASSICVTPCPPIRRTAALHGMVLSTLHILLCEY
jgi:hypothetical protein